MAYISPSIEVRDLDASFAYYTEVLGFREWFKWVNPSGKLAAAGVEKDGVRMILDLSPDAAEGRGAGVTLYIDVEGAAIDPYYEQVTAAGAKVLAAIEDKPWGDRVFTVADLDGYRISFARTNPG